MNFAWFMRNSFSKDVYSWKAKLRTWEAFTSGGAAPRSGEKPDSGHSARRDYDHEAIEREDMRRLLEGEV
jgi:hypothetical protein